MEDTLQKLSYKGNSISFYPQRGGIIVSLIIQGKELLYQDMLDTTLYTFEKNVRGGIPFLFPHAGALNKIQQRKLGYESPQHGIIKDMPFSYKLSKNKVELSYNNTPGKIPYNFFIKLIYTLSETKLKIEYTVENHSKKDFSISPGFHPYFAVANKERVIWQSSEKQGIVSEKQNWKSGGTYSFSAPKNSFSFIVPETGAIKISYDDYIKNFWIWSLPQKNFICVEPVAGDEGSIINNPIIVEPNGIFSGKIEIALL